MSRAEILSFSCGHGDEGCFTDLTMALCLPRILETSGFTTSASPHHCRSLSSTSTSAASVWRASSGSSVLTTCRVKYIQLFQKKMYHKWPISESPEIPFKILKFPLFHPWHPCLKISSISPSKELSTSLRSHRLAASLAVQPSNLTPTWDHPTVGRLGNIYNSTTKLRPPGWWIFINLKGVAC